MWTAGIISWKKKDEQQGFEILRKYFRPDEITSAVARVYFEQGQDIYNRAKITGHKKIAIYYRYLGYDNMDEKVLECMQYLIQRGNDVILYTDQDRKELTEGTDKYGKELVYLPDAVSANWGDYEARCNAFYKQMLKDKIEVFSVCFAYVAYMLAGYIAFIFIGYRDC